MSFPGFVGGSPNHQDSEHTINRTVTLLRLAARVRPRSRLQPLVDGLITYTHLVEDIRREYLTEKACAPNCTVSCVHQISIMDSWRAPQHPSPPSVATGTGELVQLK
jgi:hypothetical protein